jgi:glycosyltransferase involved in cell wall biosynthesis
MRIAHLIDSLHWGGAQKLLVMFAEEARKRGLDFTIVSLRPNTKNSPYPDQLASLGARVIMLSIDRLYDRRALPTVINLLERERFDVIQTHLQHSNILGVIAGRLANVPVIATLHSTRAHAQGRFHFLRQWLERLCLRYGAARVIAVGYSVEAAARTRLQGSHIEVVPNPVQPADTVDAFQRRALRAEIMGETGKFLILSVGRLTVDKGYDDLLEAFSRVARDRTDVFLAIAGGGELQGRLEARIAELGLNNCAKLLGPRTDIPALLEAADLYVSASHREGLSMALMEAMVHGLPIVATKVGDTEYLLGGERGVLIEPQDVDALARQIGLLLDDPQQSAKLGAAAHEFAVFNCTPHVWLNRLMEIYEQVGVRKPDAWKA